VYVLRSSIAPLDFSTELHSECEDDDSGDIAFIHAMGLING
jgi:hypothetical protein